MTCVSVAIISYEEGMMMLFCYMREKRWADCRIWY